MQLHQLAALSRGDDFATRQLRKALERDGLAVFDDVGIDQDLIDLLGSEFDHFFNRPLVEKRKFEDIENGHQRGYTPPRTEHARDQPPEMADLKEFWQEGPANYLELGLLPNVVTDNPVFDRARNAFHTALRAQVDVVLRVIAPILEVRPEWLVNYAAGGDDIVRFLRYFSLDGVDFPPGALRSSPHTDINLITMLMTRGRGLVVENMEGKHVEIDVGPRQLVVQMGDMIDVLSGGRLPATRHWVENPNDRSVERTSIAMFNHPAPLRWVDILPHLRKPGSNWDARTERSFTFERLIEIGILEEPNPFLGERVSQGYPVPTDWADGSV